MAKINSINNETSELTIDPGASGDSWVQFSINGTGEFRIGVDDNDSDSFKISQGSALGTNDTFVMSASGERTLPLQPAFLASINTENNATGATVTHTIGSITATTEVFDIGSDFTPGNGSGTGATFEAPVTGLYLLGAVVGFDVDPTGGDGGWVRIVASNRSFIFTRYPTENQVTGFSGTNGDLKFTGLGVIDMDVSDTSTVTIQIGPGSQVDDVIDGYISGALLG